MNQQEYLKEFKVLTDKMYEITKMKNTDYSGAAAKSAFENFMVVEEFGISTEHGFITRMLDKMKRISNLIGNEPAVADEKIEDTLLDLANYALLFLLYLKSKKRTVNLEEDDMCLIEDGNSYIIVNGFDSKKHCLVNHGIDSGWFMETGEEWSISHLIYLDYKDSYQEGMPITPISEELSQKLIAQGRKYFIHTHKKLGPSLFIETEGKKHSTLN